MGEWFSCCSSRRSLCWIPAVNRLHCNSEHTEPSLGYPIPAFSPCSQEPTDGLVRRRMWLPCELPEGAVTAQGVCEAKGTVLKAQGITGREKESLNSEPGPHPACPFEGKVLVCFMNGIYKHCWLCAEP